MPRYRVWEQSGAAGWMRWSNERLWQHLAMLANIGKHWRIETIDAAFDRALAGDAALSQPISALKILRLISYTLSPSN